MLMIIMMTKMNALMKMMRMMIKVVRRESDARVEKKIKLEDILEIEKRWEGRHRNKESLGYGYAPTCKISEVYEVELHKVACIRLH